MSRCTICKQKDTKGSLCEQCENNFNNDFYIATGKEIDFKIGDTLYTTKIQNSNGRQISVIIPVIYKGPSTWSLNKWHSLGVKYLTDTRYRRYGFLQCSESNKKVILQRQPYELFKTYEECFDQNKSAIASDNNMLKKDIIIKLVMNKLNELDEGINSEILDDEKAILKYLIEPAFDEIKFREEQYQEIRNEIRKSIIENELKDIRKEIISEIYSDIKSNFDKFFNKYLKD